MIYTSAPETFEAPGLGIVAMTRELPKPLTLAMRKLSRFDFFRDTPSDSAFAVCSHITEEAEGTRWHVLTRTCSAGLDYTARNNFVSHHIAIPDEMFGGEVTVFDILNSRALFETTWSGAPRFLEQRKLSLIKRCRPFPWQKTTSGQAGLQALMTWTQQSERPVFVMGSNPDMVLGAFADAASRLSREKANSLTFVSPLGADLRGITFDWIGLVEGVGIARQATNVPTQRLLDLNRPAPAVAEIGFVVKKNRAPISFEPPSDAKKAALAEDDEDDFFKTFAKPAINRQRSQSRTAPSNEAPIPPPPKTPSRSMAGIVTFFCIGVGLLLGVIGTLVWMSDPVADAVAFEEKPAMITLPNSIPDKSVEPARPSVKEPRSEKHQESKLLPKLDIQPDETPRDPMPKAELPDLTPKTAEVPVSDQLICLDAGRMERWGKTDPEIVYECALLPGSTKRLRQLGVDGQVHERKFNGKRPTSQIYLEDVLVAEVALEDDRRVIVKPEPGLGELALLRLSSVDIVLTSLEGETSQHIRILFNDPFPAIRSYDNPDSESLGQRWRSPMARAMFDDAFPEPAKGEAKPVPSKKNPGKSRKQESDSEPEKHNDVGDESDQSPAEQSESTDLKRKPKAAYSLKIESYKIPFVAGQPFHGSVPDAIPLFGRASEIPFRWEPPFQINAGVVVLHNQSGGDQPMAVALLSHVTQKPTAEQMAMATLLRYCTLEGEFRRHASNTVDVFPILIFGDSPARILQPVPANPESNNAPG
ncbi:hypothetical protein [Bremerella cremea]|uniref:GAP1-N2 domain-containing protein n=1 Tax=Bremerella cremea TaxID=1031537 RepID=UPI0031EE8613